MTVFTGKLVSQAALALTLLAVAGFSASEAIAGGCCLGGGICITTDAAGCDAVVGDYLGDASTCDGVDCTGACCRGTQCAQITHDDCIKNDGEYQGPETTCALACPGPMTDAFTYQGQLKQSGGPLTGSVDLEFTLWTSAVGTEQAGTTQQVDNVTVAGGLFSVELDFGTAVFGTDSRWLQVAVRSPHDVTDAASFTTLAPRQLLTSAPYALKTRGISVDENSKVGIGTNTPTEALDVAGTIRGRDQLIIGSPLFFHVNPTGRYARLGRDYAIGIGEVFGIGSNNNYWTGMYIEDTGASGQPYYGYRNGSTSAYMYLSGTNIENTFWALAIDGYASIWARSTYSATGYSFNVYANAIGNAAKFNGHVDVNGTLTKNGGSFKIDHPLDPENKFLSHSFVESPDMMNIYNGNVVTDRRGYATVEMPDYFDALNRDFRYQLTVLDGEDSEFFIHAKIVQEIEGGQFAIRTSRPQTKVSWQVTGVRQDAWANAHRIQVVEEKPRTERGLYRNPAVHGQPAEKGIGFMNNPSRKVKPMEINRPRVNEVPGQ